MVARVQVRLVDGSRITWRSAWLRSSLDIVFGLIGMAGNIYIFTQLPSAGLDIPFERLTDLMAEKEPAWLRYTGYVAIVWIWSELLTLLCNKKRRALHDFIAGTVVVRLESAEPSSR